MVMPKVFNIMQYCKHPITGEVLITEEQIKSLFERRTIKSLAYILHDEEDFDEEDEENDLNRCKKEYEKLSEEEKKETSLEEYVKKNHWKKAGDKKPPHFHVVFRTDRNTDLETVADWLGIPVQYVDGARYRKGERDGQLTFVDLLRYLTHESEKEQAKGKHRYPDEKVIANFDFRAMIDEADIREARYGNKSPKDYYRHKVAYEGMSISEVIAENEDAYLKDMTFLDKCRSKYLAAFAKMPDLRINIYLDGAGGIGKNTASKAIAHVLYPDMAKAYFEAGGENTSFEGYDGEPVIIWNDCRSTDMVQRFERNELFDILDPHPTDARHNIKFGSVRLTNPINIINGIEPYNKFLDGLAGAYVDKRGVMHSGEDRSQAYRRFPIIMCLREDDYDLLFNKGVFNGTREYMEYISYNGLVGSFAKVSQRLAGQAKEVVIVDMTKPVLDSVIKLKDNDIKKIEDVEDIPDEFKNYGKKKEDVQTLEDQAKNWVWTPGK